MSTIRKNPLHLYRALLRETTYLPDAAAQRFHARHIALSYRRRKDGLQSQREVPSAFPSQSEGALLKRARQYLYMLQRANQGHIRPLENVLKTTYARVGRRKRELMEELMVVDSTIPDASPSAAAKYSNTWKPPANFALLMTSQTRLQGHIEKKKIIPRPTIPAKTRSDKPFPAARVEKMLRKWYAKTASLLQPPLEEAEWISVYRASTTTASAARRPVTKRRPVASVNVITRQEDHHPLPSALISAISCTSGQRLEPQSSYRVRLKTGRPHNLTPRFLRRITQRAVLQRSPTILADVEANRLNLRWESGNKPSCQPYMGTPSQNLSMFG